MNADVSPSSDSDLQTHLTELGAHVKQLEAQIAMLDQRLATADAAERAELETQLRTAVAEHGSAIEEANGLRSRLGQPVVVPVVPMPAIMTDPPRGGTDEWATTDGG